MKTQNNKLDFRKRNIIELNDEKMDAISGGTTSFSLAVSLSVYTITILTKRF
ncbi:class I lanthipeptide [Pontimicrobium sp. MEBiC01747]|jgi:bacteriocin-like protein